MKKLWIVWPPNHWDGVYYLLNDDWFWMASHYCSNSLYAKSDLLEWREERKEKWKDYLSEWYELNIADENTTNLLLEKNKKFADATFSNKYEKEHWL